MFMLTLFESKKVRTEKAHMRNLIALAKADGRLSKSEVELILKFGEARGLDNMEVSSLIEETYSNRDVKVPATDTERFEQIFELVQIMLADNKVEDEEVDFCIEIAEKSGFS